MVILILILGALLNLTTGFATYHTATGKLIDRRFTKWYKKLTPKGWKFIGCCALLIIINLIQYIVIDLQNQKDQNIRDNKIINQYNDGIIKMKRSFDSSAEKNRVDFSKSSEAIISDLAKYKLRYDSAQNKIVEVMKDSAKTIIYNAPDPIIAFVPAGYNNAIEMTKELPLTNFKLNFVNEEAPSIIKSINVSVAYMDSSFRNPIYLGFDQLADTGKVLGKNHTFSKEFQYPNTPSYGYFIFWVHGTYSNIARTKLYKVDEMIFYNFKANTIKQVTGHSRKIIMNQILNSEGFK